MCYILLHDDERQRKRSDRNKVRIGKRVNVNGVRENASLAIVERKPRDGSLPFYRDGNSPKHEPKEPKYGNIHEGSSLSSLDHGDARINNIDHPRQVENVRKIKRQRFVPTLGGDVYEAH